MFKKLFTVIMLSFLLTACAGILGGGGSSGNTNHSATEADTDYQTGMNYVLGRGVPQDYAKAIAYLQKAADRNNPYAQNELGYLYFAGKGVPQNYAMALQFYERSAAAGIPSAQYSAGLMYLQGYGTAVDPNKAREYFQKSAAQGFTPANKML